MESIKQYIVLAYSKDDFRDLVKYYKNIQPAVDQMDRDDIVANFGEPFAELVEKNRDRMAQD
jgi:hypothetical protein